MASRINISDIITAHFKTLRAFGQDKGIFWEDAFTFIVAPISVALLFTYFQIHLDNQVANLIAIISIFGGFLFNLLAIIYGYLDKIKTVNSNDEKKLFANEINANISFCILLSIFTVIILLIYNFVPFKVNSGYVFYFKNVLLVLTYYSLFLFFLTLLMVLSRIFVLLQRENE